MRTAIVTGGRRGIGSAIAIALSAIGYNILIVDVDRDEDAEKTLVEVNQRGAEAAFAVADVADIETHASIIAAAAKLPGSLACLVNNAGVTSLVRGDMLELSSESYDRCMGVNLRGSFFLSQRFAKYLIANTSPREGLFRSIINITSANAEILGLERADYTLSKVGMSAMTRLYAARLADYRIHVYEIRPGMIKTEMTAAVSERYDAIVAAGGVPFGRWGVPSDVAEAAGMLASGALRFTTGDFIWVDGGIHLRKG